LIRTSKLKCSIWELLLLISNVTLYWHHCYHLDNVLSSLNDGPSPIVFYMFCIEFDAKLLLEIHSRKTNEWWYIYLLDFYTILLINSGFGYYRIHFLLYLISWIYMIIMLWNLMRSWDIILLFFWYICIHVIFLYVSYLAILSCINLYLCISLLNKDFRWK
jgi:hypothetical protein